MATVITVEGEIDASNTKHFTEAICHFAGLLTPLIVDLSPADFVGVDAFVALLTVNDKRGRSDPPFAVVTGSAISPLEKAFPDHGLHLADSVDAALLPSLAGIRRRGRPAERVARQPGAARQEEPQRLVRDSTAT